MRVWFLLLPLLATAGCSDRFQPRTIRECAQASALVAEVEREYSKLLRSTDPALGPVHQKAAAEAVTTANAWKKDACRL